MITSIEAGRLVVLATDLGSPGARRQEWSRSPRHGPPRRPSRAGSRPARRRQPAGNATAPPRSWRRRWPRTPGVVGSARRCAWAGSTAWRRRGAPPPSLDPLAPLDAVLAGRVDDCHQADDGAVAVLPADWEGGEGAAPAGDLVEVAADVLEADDAVAEELAVAGLPLGEVVAGVAPGQLLVLVQRPRRQRGAGCLRVPADGGRQRVVERLLVDADRLDPTLAQPDARLLVEAGRVDEVSAGVGVVVVPTGVDEHEIAGAALGARRLQVLRGDDLPPLLGDRDRHAGAEELLQRDLVGVGGALDHVRWRVQVRRAVHHRADPLRQHPGLGVVVDALDLDVLEIWPQRRV